MAKFKCTALTGQLSRIRIHSKPLPSLFCTSRFSPIPEPVSKSYMMLHRDFSCDFSGFWSLNPRQQTRKKNLLPHPHSFFLFFFISSLEKMNSSLSFEHQPFEFSGSLTWCQLGKKIFFFTYSKSHLKIFVSEVKYLAQINRTSIFHKLVDTSQIFCPYESTFSLVNAVIFSGISSSKSFLCRFYLSKSCFKSSVTIKI